MAIDRPFPHEDAATFANMVTYTARVESLRRISWRRLLLHVDPCQLCAPDAALVFKGGTCLAKTCRSSDSAKTWTSAPVSPGGTRGDRRKAVAAYKDLVSTLPESVPGLGIADSLSGRNAAR